VLLAVGVKREAGKPWLRECAAKFGVIPRHLPSQVDLSPRPQEKIWFSCMSCYALVHETAEGLGQPPWADTFSSCALCTAHLSVCEGTSS
jgi:hypothetical protein